MGELNSASSGDAPIPAKPNAPGVNPGDNQRIGSDNPAGGARIPDPAAPARKEFLETDLATIRKIRNPDDPSVQAGAAGGTATDVGPPKATDKAGAVVVDTKSLPADPAHIEVSAKDLVVGTVPGAGQPEQTVPIAINTDNTATVTPPVVINATDVLKATPEITTDQSHPILTAGTPIVISAADLIKQVPVPTIEPVDAPVVVNAADLIKSTPTVNTELQPTNLTASTNPIVINAADLLKQPSAIPAELPPASLTANAGPIVIDAAGLLKQPAASPTELPPANSMANAGPVVINAADLLNQPSTRPTEVAVSNVPGNPVILKATDLLNQTSTPSTDLVQGNLKLVNLTTSTIPVLQSANLNSSEPKPNLTQIHNAFDVALSPAQVTGNPLNTANPLLQNLVFHPDNTTQEPPRIYLANYTPLTPLGSPGIHNAYDVALSPQPVSNQFSATPALRNAAFSPELSPAGGNTIVDASALLVNNTASRNAAITIPGDGGQTGPNIIINASSLLADPTNVRNASLSATGDGGQIGQGPIGPNIIVDASSLLAGNPGARDVTLTNTVQGGQIGPNIIVNASSLLAGNAGARDATLPSTVDGTQVIPNVIVDLSTPSAGNSGGIRNASLPGTIDASPVRGLRNAFDVALNSTNAGLPHIESQPGNFVVPIVNASFVPTDNSIVVPGIRNTFDVVLNSTDGRTAPGTTQNPLTLDNSKQTNLVAGQTGGGVIRSALDVANPGEMQISPTVVVPVKYTFAGPPMGTIGSSANSELGSWLVKPPTAGQQDITANSFTPITNSNIDVSVNRGKTDFAFNRANDPAYFVTDQHSPNNASADFHYAVFRTPNEAPAPPQLTQTSYFIGPTETGYKPESALIFSPGPDLGSWIVKPSSTAQLDLSQNGYTPVGNSNIDLSINRGKNVVAFNPTTSSTYFVADQSNQNAGIANFQNAIYRGGGVEGQPPIQIAQVNNPNIPTEISYKPEPALSAQTSSDLGSWIVKPSTASQQDIAGNSFIPVTNSNIDLSVNRVKSDVAFNPASNPTYFVADQGNQNIAPAIQHATVPRTPGEVPVPVQLAQVNYSTGPVETVPVFNPGQKSNTGSDQSIRQPNVPGNAYEIASLATPVPSNRISPDITTAVNSGSDQNLVRQQGVLGNAYQIASLATPIAPIRVSPDIATVVNNGSDQNLVRQQGVLGNAYQVASLSVPVGPNRISSDIPTSVSPVVQGNYTPVVINSDQVLSRKTIDANSAFAAIASPNIDATAYNTKMPAVVADANQVRPFVKDLSAPPTVLTVPSLPTQAILVAQNSYDIASSRSSAVTFANNTYASGRDVVQVASGQQPNQTTQQFSVSGTGSLARSANSFDINQQIVSAFPGSAINPARGDVLSSGLPSSKGDALVVTGLNTTKGDGRADNIASVAGLSLSKGDSIVGTVQQKGDVTLPQGVGITAQNIGTSGGFSRINPDGSIVKGSTSGSAIEATSLAAITINSIKIEQSSMSAAAGKAEPPRATLAETIIRPVAPGTIVDTSPGAIKLGTDIVRISTATTVTGTLIQFDQNVRIITGDVGSRVLISEIRQPISLVDSQIKTLIGLKGEQPEVTGPRAGTVTLSTGTSITFILLPDKATLITAETASGVAATKFTGKLFVDEVTNTTNPITRKGIKQLEPEGEQVPPLPGTTPSLGVPTFGIKPGATGSAVTASSQDPTGNQDPNHTPISLSSITIAIKSLPTLEIFDPANSSDRATMTPTHSGNQLTSTDIANAHSDTTLNDPGIPANMNHTGFILPSELQGQIGRTDDHNDSIGRTDEGRGIIADKIPHADPLDQLGEVSGTATTHDDMPEPPKLVTISDDSDDIGNRIMTIASDYIGTAAEAGITDRSIEDLMSDLLSKTERKRYRIQTGDTLKKIAEKLLKDKRLAGLIYLLNPELLGTDADLDELNLPPGAVLILPSAEEILQYKIHVLHDTLPDYIYEDLLQHPDERIARTAQEFRPAYACRFGDNLITVAGRHPAMSDSSIWPLLAKLNNLSDRTDAAGQPTAQLKRGQKLVMPSRKDIRDYRRRNFRTETNATLATPQEFPAVHKSPKTDNEGNTVFRPSEAAHAMNPFHGLSSPPQNANRAGVPSKARVITVPDLGDGLADLNLRLEIQHDGSWLPVMQYLVQKGQSQLHIYSLDGSSQTINIDLPSRSVRELAEADLAANYARYCLKFQKGERPI
jgi:LysM domain